MKKQPEVDRFLKSIIKTNSCWIWIKSIGKTGYGRTKTGSRSNKTRRTIGAHQWSYMLFNGPLQKDLVVDHICRLRNCVNPEHLRLVTRRINAIENSTSPPAKNQKKSTCLYGHLFTKENTYLWKNKRSCRACRLRRTKLIDPLNP